MSSKREGTIDRVLADELLMEFYTKKGRGWLAVRSGSMEPLIKPGDRVLLSPVEAEQICCGDIIVFKREGSLIVHRVLKELQTDEGVRFVEKGDSSESWGMFGPDDVIGRITLVNGKGKIFNLNTKLSRCVSHVLSIWFYRTSAIIMKSRSSPVRNIRRVGRALLVISLFSSKVLVRICSVAWYLSGVFIRENLESA